MTDYASRLVEPGNQFTFACPTVKRDALFMGCHWMKIRFWRGEVIPCADCYTAMMGGKCPAVVMLKIQDQEDIKFFDTDKKVHTLSSQIIDRIKHILLFKFHTNGRELTPEQSVILFANEEMKGGSGSAMPTKLKRKRTTPALDAPSIETDDRLAALDVIETDRSTNINKALELVNG